MNFKNLTKLLVRKIRKRRQLSCKLRFTNQSAAMDRNVAPEPSLNYVETKHFGKSFGSE